MNTRRHLVLWATTLAVAFVASGASAAHVGATVPPTTPPSTPAPSSPPGVDSQVTDPNQVVESWALAPASSDDPNQAGNRPELSYVSDAGAVVQDKVTVYNFGTVPLTFKVYATDAFNDEQGQFALLPGDKAPADVGTWVTFAQGSITVLPRQQSTIPITIKIPADAAPGDHAGAILASSPTLGTGQQGQVVTLDRRTGTRLYVRVNGGLVPELGVDRVRTKYHPAVNSLGGSATVTFRISNRGNIRLSGTPTVSIAGPFGLLARKLTLPDISELLPGQEVTLAANVSDVPASMFDFTTVRVAPHGSADAGTLHGPTGKNSFFAPPLTVLVVLLVLVIILLALRYRRRRAAGLQAVPAPNVGRQPTHQPQQQPQHQPT
jgi:hypothetical protein